MPDYYRVLNLTADADEDEIKKALNRDMRLWSNRTNAPQIERRQEAERMVKLLEEAERVLLDSSKRAQYNGNEPETDRSTQEASNPPERSVPSSRRVEEGGDISPLIEEGWRLLIDDRVGEALEIATRATEEAPTNADAWALLGQARFRLGDIEDAIYEYKRAIKLRPSEASFYSELGSIYESTERLDEALAQYQRAAQIDPKTTMYRAAIGILYVNTKNFAEAIAILERCVEEEPNNESYRDALATAYVDGMISGWWLHGDKYFCISEEQALEAKAILEKARALRVDDPEIKRNLEERGRMVDGLFKREFKGSWVMVVLLGLFWVVPGVLWWWVNRRQVFKIGRDIHDVVEQNKADTVVGGELGAYFSALPPGFKWMAYKCPRYVVWIAILMLSPFTFLYLVYDNYGPKYLAGFAGAFVLLLVIGGILAGSAPSQPRAYQAAYPQTQTFNQPSSSGQNNAPIVSNPVQVTRPPVAVGAPRNEVSGGGQSDYSPVTIGDNTVVVLPRTKSSDGRYALGWTVQDSRYWTHYDDANGIYPEDSDPGGQTTVENIVVDLGSQKVLMHLPFTSSFYRMSHRTENHHGLCVYWGPENNGMRLAVVINDGRWSPFNIQLLEIDPDKIVQTDILDNVDSAVLEYVAKQPGMAGRDVNGTYHVSFGPYNYPDDSINDAFTDAETVRLPFSAVIPKSVSDPSFNGTVLVHLSAATNGGEPTVAAVDIAGSSGVQQPNASQPVSESMATPDRQANAFPPITLPAFQPSVPSPTPPVIDSHPAESVLTQPSFAAQAMPGERFPETRTRLLAVEDIQTWSDQKLRYAINEMYARHGADFRDSQIKKWFLRFPWYHPSPGATYDDVEHEFTDIEKRNEDLLGLYRSTRKGAPVAGPVNGREIPRPHPAFQYTAPNTGSSLQDRTHSLDNF